MLDVIFAAQRQREKEEEEAKAAAEAEAKRITLNKFIKQYIADVESGARQTDKGTRYAASTVKAIKQSMVHPGEKLERIARKDVTYINIRQKKTGAKVAVPCSSDLKRIFEKYDYQLPHLEDQVINRYIKDIAKAAGLTELVNIVKTNGGTTHEVPTPKYQLIHTHTSRRTGATLMYLAGMDVYDIIKITGHTNPTMLRKYIKADELEVVEKIKDKYDYFK